MASVNKVILVGNLGADPEVKSMQNGGKVCNLSVATSERWKDRNTGEQREKTEWHRVVIWSEGLVNVAEQYLRKGSKVYLEGQLQTRKWQDQSGEDRYSTEVVLTGFNASMVLLDGANGSNRDPNDNAGRPGNSSGSNRPGTNRGNGSNRPTGGGGGGGFSRLDDDIPFGPEVR